MSMNDVILTVATVGIPLLAAVMERVGSVGISERHHSHHDTFVLSSAFSHALVFAMLFMGLMGLVLGWLCSIGVFSANPVVIHSFFVAFLAVMFVFWMIIRRFKVSLFDDQMIITPFLGGDVTVGYADIESMEWTGFRKGTGYRDLAIYVGGRKVVTLVGVLDLEQVLVRIHRFDVLGRSSSR
ncbi:MAG: hypothetical protein ACRC75_06975 [Olsenella sp.]